ncbi:hypothetical protein BU23DRAFT_311752 [Bimuria novae-zelandiae CBS 107.79]|uniref:C2H2-type domain-containing protein n=1 Tax=Bimuria novae-zelandiae CBS 107.79 TaxID=1447943 RepID=A0A6A5UPC1_9PLEO|nr:hypothetical protein BU23DRAFT_311752 [Bimuria novae-zelandiae CBS 107.79]
MVKMKKTYTCRHCARVFKRSEHCARHERVHTQEKPFPCAYCDRKYARKDLVKRHERTLHAEQYRKAHPEEFGSGGRLAEGSESPRIPHPLPPLTPPDEYSLNGEALYTPIVDIPSAAPSLSYAQSTLLRSSSGSSSSDGGRPFLPGMEAINFDFPPMNMEFNGLPLPETRAAYPLQVETNFYHEPPAKRQRIEIDPLITGTPLQTEMPIAETPVSQLGFTAYDAIDPNLEDATFAHSAPTPAKGTSPGWEDLENIDLSAEYLALFDMETEQSTRTDTNHPAAKPRLRVHSEACANLRNLPNLQFTEETHRIICDDLRMGVLSLGLPETLLPSFTELQQFFSGYLEGFHRHFPIIHLHSFDPLQIPSPLIMAICSIGALYRLRREKAKNLFVLAGTMSSHALHNGLPIVNGSPEPAPLWVMQTRVLLSLAGMFSGMAPIVLRTLENLGLFAIDFRLRKALLNRSTSDGLDWDEWIYRESSKRLLFGMYVVSNLISATFGVTTGFSQTDDLGFEDLDEERFWNATAPEEWHLLRASSPPAPRSSVRDVLGRLLLSPDATPPPQVSILTMLLLTHALNTHTESIRQALELTPAVLHDTILAPTTAALAACEDVLAAARQRKDSSTPWTEAEGPLMFNAEGVIHMAHVRLHLDMSVFNRLMLISDNVDEIADAAAVFADVPLRRSPALTSVMRKAYERHHVLVKLGHSLLRKTAALSWSLEHAVADWVGILLVTKFLHVLETATTPECPPAPEETEIREGFKRLLAETDCEYTGSSLASAVAHYRSTMLNDVWVWGVTPKMALVLQHLAYVYEERRRGF